MNPLGEKQVDECSEIERNQNMHTYRVGNMLYYVIDREVRKQMILGLVMAPVTTLCHINC